MVPAAQTDIPTVLARLHAEVRRELTWCSDDDSRGVGRNPKGDIQHRFDLAADSAVRRCLEREIGSGIVLSEECGEYRFGQADPAYRFVVDPVDGSDNRQQRLPLHGVSVAVLPADGPVAVEHVLWALVGGLEEEAPIIASRGAGAFRNGERIRVSGQRGVPEAFVSCELNHCTPSPRLAALVGRVRAVRCYGCCSRSLALVASGALDAHIDVRGRLTPENFLAAGLILEEAGGCLLRPDGQPLGEFALLTQRSSLVAAATTELAQEIIDALADDGV